MSCGQLNPDCDFGEQAVSDTRYKSFRALVFGVQGQLFYTRSKLHRGIKKNAQKNNTNHMIGKSAHPCYSSRGKLRAQRVGLLRSPIVTHDLTAPPFQKGDARQALGFRVQRVQGLGVQGLGFRVYRVQGLGVRVQGLQSLGLLGFMVFILCKAEPRVLNRKPQRKEHHNPKINDLESQAQKAIQGLGLGRFRGSGLTVYRFRVQGFRVQCLKVQGLGARVRLCGRVVEQQRL